MLSDTTAFLHSNNLSNNSNDRISVSPHPTVYQHTIVLSTNEKPSRNTTMHPNIVYHQKPYVTMNNAILLPEQFWLSKPFHHRQDPFLLHIYLQFFPRYYRNQHSFFADNPCRMQTEWSMFQAGSN